ncbi:hypothetical protein D3C78_1771920 [compost metagenome]
MGKAIVHTRINLRIIFGFGDIDDVRLFIQFANGFTDGRMPVNRAINGIAKLERTRCRLARRRGDTAIQ